MAYYGRRRYNPAADDRRAREEKDQARLDRDRAKLQRILRLTRKVALRGPAAQHAWGSKEIRSYRVGKTSNGDAIITTIRTDGTHLFLQEAGGMGWNFYRLTPKHHVLRPDEEGPERDQSRARRRVRRRLK